MNIYQIDADTFEFAIFNLLGPLDGHYTFRWKRDGSYVLKKHGDYANLTSYVPVEEEFREPTDEEKEYLADYIDDAVGRARFFDVDKPNYEGERLIPGAKQIICSHKIFQRRETHST